jgi:predicted phosphodiesterase
MMTRRFFIGGAAGLFALRPNRIFSASGAAETFGTPALTFGVVSDVHIAMAKGGREVSKQYMTDTFKATLARFRDAGVDAVVIAGDIAHHGLAPELIEVGKAWYEIFPGDRAPDGRKVERIFVTGNHDNGSGRANRVYSDAKEAEENLLARDYRKWWDKVFHEEWQSSFMKEVKGFSFTGFNWMIGDCRGKDENFNREIADFYAKHGRSLDPSKPFFHIQHPHPKGTVHGEKVWGQDEGMSTKALMAHPNAIAFSGHSHISITDERAVWQGGFTSIGCGTLRNVSLAMPGVCSLPHGYENGKTPKSLPPEIEAGKAMKIPERFNCRQEQLVRVYGDCLRISRREAISGVSYGPDLVMPLPAAERRPFDFKMREAKAMAPEFPAASVLSVTRKKGNVRGTKAARNVKVHVWEIAFPQADAVRNVLAAAYEVLITGDDGFKLELGVSNDAFRFPADSPKSRTKGVCRVDCSRIPVKRFTVSVRAVSCWGRRSAPLEAKV